MYLTDREPRALVPNISICIPLKCLASMTKNSRWCFQGRRDLRFRLYYVERNAQYVSIVVLARASLRSSARRICFKLLAAGKTQDQALFHHPHGRGEGGGGLRNHGCVADISIAVAARRTRQRVVRLGRPSYEIWTEKGYNPSESAL